MNTFSNSLYVTIYLLIDRAVQKASIIFCRGQIRHCRKCDEAFSDRKCNSQTFHARSTQPAGPPYPKGPAPSPTPQPFGLLRLVVQIALSDSLYFLWGLLKSCLQSPSGHVLQYWGGSLLYFHCSRLIYTPCFDYALEWKVVIG